MRINQISKILLFTLISVLGGRAYAGIIVGGTRVIYDGSKREASLSVNNPDKIPYLIQTWTDNDGPTEENKGSPKPPFIITPPLFRLDAGNENIVRIIRTGGVLPEDRESVYWMNVKSIPASTKGNKNILQISVKTRIKLIYRPKDIKAPSDEDYKAVSFQRIGNEIKVNNPTPYYFSLFSMKLGDSPVITTNVMVPPKNSVRYPVPAEGNGTQISWQVINDFGGSSKINTSKLQ